MRHLLRHTVQQAMVAALTAGLVEFGRDATLSAVSAWSAIQDRPSGKTSTTEATA